MEVFDVLFHQPVSQVLVKYLKLPEIIRLSATCRRGYNEWIHRVKILDKTWPFYKAKLNITDLRKVCLFYFLLNKDQVLSRTRVNCVGCGVDVLLISSEVFSRSVCSNCFLIRFNYLGIIHITAAVERMMKTRLFDGVSPYDILNPFTFKVHNPSWHMSENYVYEKDLQNIINHKKRIKRN